MRRFAQIAGPICASLMALAGACLASPAQAQSAEALTFVRMKEISVPIIDAGRMDGILHITLVLQARTEGDVIPIRRKLAELRSAGLGAAIEFARLYASPYAPVDVERLSERMSEAMKNAVPEIDKVLIVEVSARAG